MSTEVEKFVLFGIPFAGGSADATYLKWARYLPSCIEICPLELSGHGRRLKEPLSQCLAEVVEDLVRRVSPVAQRQSYGFYGHSMGTVVTYELVKAIARRGLPGPVALFLSGRNPPHLGYASRDIHCLSDAAFLEEIRAIGGTPRAFFEDKRLVETFLPVLRQDYKIIERYRFEEPIQTTEADIVVFASDQDPLVTRPAVLEWARYTCRDFSIHDARGGHFFIEKSYPEICSEIARRIRSFQPGFGDAGRKWAPHSCNEATPPYELHH